MKYILMLLVFLAAACGDDGGVGPDAAPPASNGDACELDEACTSETCVIDLLDGDIHFPNGMCMQDCSGNRFGCDEGSNCVPVQSGDAEAYCAIFCVNDDECRVDEDYGCIKLSPWEIFRYCLPESLRRPWDDGTQDTAG